jgi:fimbrial isopeptide formation D2 family protein/LPXTG-motif cell wall-anchored protein
MKKFTKLLGIVLIMALVMSMGTAAFAAGTNSITVDLNFKGQTYTLYKIFNATTNAARQGATDTDHDTSVTTDGIAYTLIDEDATANSGHALTALYSITKADGTTKNVTAGDWFEYVNSSSKNIQLKSGADITTEEFRLFAEKYGVKTGDALKATSNNDASIKWTGLEDGYYFIKTTTGTLVTVDSVAPNAIVKDKNLVPTIDKTVQEDSLVAANADHADGDGINDYQKQNDQEIGKTVYYKSVIKAHKGATGYVVYDKLSKGLTFGGVNSITVYKGSVAEANVVAAANYMAAIVDKYYKGSAGTETALQEGESVFSVTFNQTFLDTIDSDVDLIITYTATVNSDAVVNTAIPNDTTLKYGTDSYTEESTTHTFVWGIDVLKHENGDETKKLKGAQFVIYRTETVTPSEGDPVTSIYYAKFDSNNKLTGWSTADTTAESALVAKEPSYFSGTTYAATILETGSDGTVAVTGLDEGTYKLLEVKAPDGYNKLAAAETVTIDSTSDTATAKSLENAISAGTNGSQNVKVANSKGAVLPSTGGIGTTIFYVVGSIFVVAAGVLLITKKRMSREG